MRIQPKGDLLPEAIVKLPGNCTNGVRSCAKFDAHTYYHCQKWIHTETESLNQIF